MGLQIPFFTTITDRFLLWNFKKDEI
jgi:hypothetical protein